MPELEGDKDFMNYKFIDRDLDLDLKEYEQHYEKLQTELEIIGEQLTIMMGDEDIEDATEIDEKGSQNLIDLKNYINKLLEEDDYLIDKIKYLRGREREDILEEAKATPLPEDLREKEKQVTKIQSLMRGKKGKMKLETLKRIAKRYKDEEEEKKLRKEQKGEQYERERMRKEDEGLSDEEPDVEESIPKDLKIPPFGQDTSDVRDFLDIGQVLGAKRAFKNLGFESRTINKLSLGQIRQIIDAYDQGKVVGAGRYRGGAKKRGRPKKQQTIRISATTPATATPTTPPIIDVGDPELIEEEYPEAEIRKNEKVAEKLDDLLVETVNIEDSTPSQTYIAKANELTTGLIQFLGRTTVLYITRIKKNLNYMDEDQIKIIVDNYTKLKPNLDKLNYYKNTGGALIKETLYNQLTKETLGLYNEINDSIRNVKKIKNYTIFSGAGMNQYRGGYFIQSDNPFIMHTTTKRFL